MIIEPLESRRLLAATTQVANLESLFAVFSRTDSDGFDINISVGGGAQTLHGTDGSFAGQNVDVTLARFHPTQGGIGVQANSDDTLQLNGNLSRGRIVATLDGEMNIVDANGDFTTEDVTVLFDMVWTPAPSAALQRNHEVIRTATEHYLLEEREREAVASGSIKVIEADGDITEWLTGPSTSANMFSRREVLIIKQPTEPPPPEGRAALDLFSQTRVLN